MLPTSCRYECGVLRLVLLLLLLLLLLLEADGVKVFVDPKYPGGFQAGAPSAVIPQLRSHAGMQAHAPAREAIEELSLMASYLEAFGGWRGLNYYYHFGALNAWCRNGRQRAHRPVPRTRPRLLHRRHLRGCAGRRRNKGAFPQRFSADNLF